MKYCHLADLSVLRSARRLAAGADSICCVPSGTVEQGSVLGDSSLEPLEHNPVNDDLSQLDILFKQCSQHKPP